MQWKWLSTSERDRERCLWIGVTSRRSTTWRRQRGGGAATIGLDHANQSADKNHVICKRGVRETDRYTPRTYTQAYTPSEWDKRWGGTWQTRRHPTSIEIDNTLGLKVDFTWSLLSFDALIHPGDKIANQDLRSRFRSLSGGDWLMDLYFLMQISIEIRREKFCLI